MMFGGLQVILDGSLVTLILSMLHFFTDAQQFCLKGNPQSFITFTLASAPPLPPLTIAPACPIVLPGGAVFPAINAIVKLIAS